MGGLIWRTPLHQAACRGDEGQVELLIAQNPELVNATDDYFGKTALHAAAEHGHGDIYIAQRP